MAGTSTGGSSRARNEVDEYVMRTMFLINAFAYTSSAIIRFVASAHISDRMLSIISNLIVLEFNAAGLFFTLVFSILICCVQDKSSTEEQEGVELELLVQESRKIDGTYPHRVWFNISPVKPGQVTTLQCSILGMRWEIQVANRRDKNGFFNIASARAFLPVVVIVKGSISFDDEDVRCQCLEL